MPVDVEVRFVAVHPLANVVGHPTRGENVAGAVENEGVVGSQPFSGKNFRVNRRQTRVVGLERVALRNEHPLDDIAGSGSKSQ
jgi:hypothetical protein